MIRILLTGATGQIGWELSRALAPLGAVLTPTHAELNLARPETLAAAVDEAQPDVIVNAAAYTAVDQAAHDMTPAVRRAAAHGGQQFRLGVGQTND